MSSGNLDLGRRRLIQVAQLLIWSSKLLPSLKLFLWSYKRTYINHLTQSYNKKSLILNAEIEINKNKRCMWIRSKKKERKWYKWALRPLGWPIPRKLRYIWRRTRFRSWTWHQSSLFSSIQLHPCKKIQWSCKNMISLHKNTNENPSLEENLTWYLYKMIRNHSPWIEEVFPTKIPWLVDLVPNNRNLH